MEPCRHGNTPPSAPWDLKEEEIRTLFGHRGGQARFPCFEIELESEILRLGHIPAHWTLDSPSFNIDDADNDFPGEDEALNPGAALNHWHKLDPAFLGSRKLRFGLLLTHPEAQMLESVTAMEGQLRMPSTSSYTSLKLIDILRLSVAQLERLRQFHITLLWLVFGNTSLAQPTLPQLHAFVPQISLEALIVPLYINPPLRSPLPASTSPLPHGSAFDSHSHSSSYTTRPTVALNATTAPSTSDKQSTWNQPLPPLEPKSLVEYVNWGITDVFTKARSDEPFDPTRHGPGSILRTTYGSALFVYLEEALGQDTNTIVDVMIKTSDAVSKGLLPHTNTELPRLDRTLEASMTTSSSLIDPNAFTYTSDKKAIRLRMSVQEYLSSVWQVHDVPPVRSLILSCSLVFKYLYAPNSFPTATKWIAPSLLARANCRDQAWKVVNQDLSKCPEEDVPEAVRTLTESFYKSRPESKLEKKLVPSLVEVLPISLLDLNVAAFLPTVLLSVLRRIASLRFQLTVMSSNIHMTIPFFQATPLSPANSSSLSTSSSSSTPSSTNPNRVLSSGSLFGSPDGQTPSAQPLSSLARLAAALSSNTRTISSDSQQRGPATLQQSTPIRTSPSASSSPIPISRANLLLLEEALTLPNVAIDFNYESLESLGDSVLKYIVSFYLFLADPRATEGQMTFDKISKTSNKFLASCPNAPAIHEACFFTEMWSDLRLTKRRNTLSLKARADLCESVLGYFYVQYGEEGANFFLSWLSPSLADLVSRALQVLHQPDVLDLTLLTPNIGWDQHWRAHESLSLPGRYKFKKLFLLETAMTHTSATRRPTGQTYDRLEFLGDACLDLLITSVLFHQERRRATPGMITLIRGQISSNASYAFLAATLGLQLGLIYDSASIFQDLRSYLVSISKRLESSPDPKNFDYLIGSAWIRNISFPDIMADAFEACAGAILMDNRGDFRAFTTVYLPLVRHLVRRHLEGDILEYGRRHPKSELIELLQSKHCLYGCKLVSEDSSQLLIWHDLTLSKTRKTGDSRLDELTLFQDALKILLMTQGIWSKCDCANPPKQL